MSRDESEAEYQRQEALCDEAERGVVYVEGKTCRVCLTGGLFWKQTERGWRLFDHGGEHSCPGPPTKKKEDAR